MWNSDGSVSLFQDFILEATDGTAVFVPEANVGWYLLPAALLLLNWARRERAADRWMINWVATEDPAVRRQSRPEPSLQGCRQ